MDNPYHQPTPSWGPEVPNASQTVASHREEGYPSAVEAQSLDAQLMVLPGPEAA